MSLVAALGLLLLPSPAPACPAWASGSGPLLEQVEVRLVEQVNDARRAAGLRALAAEPRLRDVARRHAGTMARLRTMSHSATGAGDTLEARLRDAGFHDWNTVGENIAMGHSVDWYAQNAQGGERSVRCHGADSLARDIFRAWLASPGHRAALLDPAFTHVGSGAAYDPAGEKVYVTHDFARLVTCGYGGAPCCPPPEGLTGGVCQLPHRCRAGTCVVPPPPSPAPHR